MLKAILGSALGGLAAGAVALVASAQGRPAPADPWATQAANGARAITIADSQGGSVASTTTPTLVQCEPQQEAVLRRSVLNGREVAEVTCVSRIQPAASAPAASYQAVGYSDGSDIVTRPAMRTPSVSRPVVRERVVYRQAREDARPKRSWQKTALVIGGSAGAGAGVGAIAGGKKGALIGAAIGGGAASVYEAMKRR